MSMILKSRRLINPGRRRRNVAQGFYNATGFHPIRASSDYDSGRLFDSENEPRGGSRRRTTKRKVKAKGRSTRRKNPGKRKLSPKQIAIFGTKRQKAALKAARSRKRRLSNPSIRKTVKRMRKAGFSKKTTSANRTDYKRHARKTSIKRRARRLSNVGEIITLSLPGINPGRRKKRSSTTMATRKRRVVRRRRRTAVTTNPRRRRRTRRLGNPRPIRRRRRHHAVTHRRRRRTTRNPGVKVVYRYKGKRRNGKRRYSRRRNPGFGNFLSGNSGISKVLGILGGAALTKFIVSKLPASLSTGIPGYITTAVVGTLGGKLVGKVLKKPALGADLVLGGWVLLGLKLLSDFVPGFATYMPFGLNGLGLIGGSSFYTPQVPANGSIASGMWTLPSAIPVAAPALRGLGERMNQRRGGRAF